MNDSEKLKIQGDVVRHAAGTMDVLICAIGALVQTHPDPSVFALEFRRLWQRLGSPNESDTADELRLAGIDEALSVVEGSCPVPLGVRPPDAATKPGQ